ncbi:MAG: hypothetical protein IPJ40_14600 [Saprospirales bacterium]|nr:hypothetical protein [Saprospirales bacterium]
MAKHQGWKATAGLTLSRNKIRDYVEFMDRYDQAFEWVGQQAADRGEVDLAFSPGVIATGQIAYDFLYRSGASKGRSLELALLNNYVGKQYLDNSGASDSVLDSYFYSDLRLVFAFPVRWTKRLEAAFLVSNVWNQFYASNGWSYRYVYVEEVETDKGFYPQAGRNFLLSLKIDL